MKHILIGLLVFTGFFCNHSLKAQNELTPLFFIYDASGSMWGEMAGSTKKQIAAKVLNETIGPLPENQPIGLMLYGHRRKGDCDDIELVADINNTSKEKISKAIANLNPKGKTPLARTAKMVIDQLRQSKGKATIILVTDGIESCDGDLCEVIGAARVEGIEFKLHIIGFGLKETETQALRCAARAGGGRYFHATNDIGLSDMLKDATRRTVDKPSGNFTVTTVKNAQYVDAWVRVKRKGEDIEVKSARTYKDTASLYLPDGNYEVTVKPLENSDISSQTIDVHMFNGIPVHEDLSFDFATVVVHTTNNNVEGHDCLVKLLDFETNKEVASTRTYGKAKELDVDPGVYKIVFQALNLEGEGITFEIQRVELKAGDYKEVNHDFSSGKLLVGVQKADGTLVDATVNIYAKESNKNVANGRTYTAAKNNPKSFTLNPGVYNVKIVSLGKHKGQSQTFDIHVIKGQSVQRIVKIN